MTAEHTKSLLRGLLRDAHTYNETVAAAETVITVLQNTMGFWVKLNYSYQAAEIADRVREDLDQHIDHSCGHRDLHAKAIALREKAMIARRVYRAAWNDYLQSLDTPVSLKRREELAAELAAL